MDLRPEWIASFKNETNNQQIQIIQSLTKTRTTIMQKQTTEPQRTLGYHISPSGNEVDTIKCLQTKAKEHAAAL